MGTLEDRFSRFMGNRPGAEAIDKLELPPGKSDSRRADFFLAERRLIVELKTIENDPSPKIEEVLAKHRLRSDFPLFYGPMQVEKVLQHLPDGDAIKQRMLQVVLRSVEAGFRSANEQIAGTKGAFETPNAQGMLVLLNETVPLLSLDVVAWQIAQMLQARTQAGDVRYGEINCVWMISETHYIPSGKDLKLIPALLMRSEQVSPSDATWQMVRSLQPAWASFIGVPFVDGGVRTTDHLGLHSFSSADSTTPAQLPRHEWWRRAYRANPTLRGLTESELLEHAAALLDALAPRLQSPEILCGDEHTGPDDKRLTATEGLMEHFTHFLEEAQFRGVDMRSLTDLIRARRG